MSDELTRGRSGRPRNEVRLLYRVSTAINAALGVERVLAVAMDGMDELFGIRHCSVYLVDADNGGLVLSANRGEASPRQRQRERERVGRGIVGTAAAKREIVRLNREVVLSESPRQTAIESRMAIPMLAEDELVGVLFVLTLGDKVLRKGDEELVTIVANQSAVAVQNARLYEGLQRLNQSLEERVRARTAELEASNRELREAQARLVQSSKLAALGQLAAGLSHEMNTPLGAITSSLDLGARAAARVRETGAVAAGDAAHKLERALQAIEDSSQVARAAAARLFAVFQTLRDFAHLDQAALQWTDLHDGLEQSLSLLGHRLERIALARDFGELPRVRCYASEINQVFLIVLTNAADAIAGDGTIALRTRTRGERAVVDIADDGRGMAPAQLQRVFDPGFTTKGQRVGAGLSLGIAYRIMERHGGSIELDSTLGQGTTVTLQLPVAGPPAP